MKNTAFTFSLLLTFVSTCLLNAAQEQNQTPEIQTQVTLNQTNLNMEQLPEAYKKAVALALAKMAQNLAPSEPKSTLNQDAQTEHLVLRTSSKTLIKLQPTSNDIYNITLKIGDTLILAASREHPAFYWETDIIAIDPEVLNYAKRELIPQKQFEGACLFYMHFNALKPGEVEMTFNSENFVGAQPTSQQLKIAIE